jgi:hypothetical protein
VGGRFENGTFCMCTALVCDERGGWAVSLGIYSTRSPGQKPGKKVFLHVKILKSCIWSYCRYNSEGHEVAFFTRDI